MIVTNAHLLDPEAGELSDRSWLEIASGRIVDRGAGDPPPAADSVRVLDAAGGTVLPGLIDAHVHVTITSWDFADLRTWHAGYWMVRALKEAGRMLGRGFTSVRDVAGANHAMARVLREGLMPGPRLFYGGRALSQTGGHGDVRPLSEDAVDSCCSHGPGFSRIADGVDAVRAAARDELRKGAHHLKVMVSGGVASPHDEISAVQYSEAELRAVVEEAANHNRYVTVHAYHPKAINRALAAGVRCVEHGNLLDDETLGLLLEHDAFLVPTVACYDHMARSGASNGMSEVAQRKVMEVRDDALAALERAHKSGVKIVYGSDLLGPLQRYQLDEFRMRAEVQPVADIIRSATTTAAELLGMAGELGTLKPGAIADLLVIGGDPLGDVSTLAELERHLRCVVQDGAIVVGQ